MTFTCSNCGKVSQNVEQREVWPRECGFLEFTLPYADGGASGFTACSPECAATILERLPEEVMPIKPLSKTWRCAACDQVLPLNHSGVEACTPSFGPTLILPNSWRTISFCRNNCLMRFLKGIREKAFAE
jgi:hypothetical protein